MRYFINVGDEGEKGFIYVFKEELSVGTAKIRLYDEVNSVTVEEFTKDVREITKEQYELIFRKIAGYCAAEREIVDVLEQIK